MNNSLSLHKTLLEEIQDICFLQTGYPHRWPKHQQCPCCHGKSISPFFSKFNLNYDYCKTCTFVFVNPYPSEKTLSKLYNCCYYNNLRSFIETPKAKLHAKNGSASVNEDEYKKIIQLIHSHKQSGSWLDVGGGIGFFLAQVEALFPNHYNTYLNELNNDSSKLAEEIFGIKTCNHNSKKLAKDNRKFDIITSIAVMEHIPNPSIFLRENFNLLKPNGLLMFTIPKYSLFNRYLSKKHTPNVIPPYHVSLFDQRSIKALIKRTLKIDKIDFFESGPPAFSLLHLLKTSELFDVTVPTKNKKEQKVIVTGKFSYLQDKLHNPLANLDKRLESIFQFIDGKQLLHFLITNK